MVDLRRIVTGVAMATVILLGTMAVARAAGAYSFEIDAVGDDGSKGNIGVRAEIRTHLYDASEGDRDDFTIAEAFADGSAIFFGFSIRSNHIPSGAGWVWEFVPVNSSPEVKEGDASLLGLNGTWHSYSITQDTPQIWSFRLDGIPLGSVPFQTNQVIGPVYFAIQKTTDYDLGPPLGPVELRNLSYLKSDGWHSVDSLKAVSRCFLNNQANSQCNLIIPYGLALKAANDIIVGSGLPKHATGDIVWGSNLSAYLISYIDALILVAFAVIAAYFAIRRRRVIVPGSHHVNKSSTPGRDPGAGFNRNNDAYPHLEKSHR